jgi:proteic killer suppression protein
MRYRFVMVRSFRHKGLKELFETGRSAKVPSHLVKRCVEMLDALDAAFKLEDINLPGFALHPLHEKPVRHSIHVNGPWCITFQWEGTDAVKVDLQQYH